VIEEKLFSAVGLAGIFVPGIKGFLQPFILVSRSTLVSVIVI
jgi:hypothetical protein